jgi:hypothetical protein
MNRRLRRLAAALVATIALGTLTLAAAQALTPPAGTPSLSAMALQSSDLAPGAQVQGAYVKPTAHLRAEYERNFAAATTRAGVQIDAIDTELLLADTPAYAKQFYRGLKLVYGSSFGRSLLTTELIRRAGSSAHLTRKQVHYGKLRGIGVGQASLLESIAIHTRTLTLFTWIAALRIDGVVANVTLVVRRRTLAAAVPTALATTVAEHITAVLAASAGATGPAGPTGATGATG